LRPAAGRDLGIQRARKREINPGDVVQIKASERHWHGAKANSTMGYITITLVGGQAAWG
jgi:quercetin dioxygenase-like cupin family protein